MKASAISAIASGSTRCDRSSKAAAARPPEPPLLNPPNHPCPALCRASTSFCYSPSREDVDGRDEPGHGKLRGWGRGMIEFLMVADAPTPVAPFSHATAADRWLFVTGQMPTDPADDSAPLPEGIEAQTRRVMDNLKLVLAGTGSDLDRVVFARVYLTHFERDYVAMNRVYQTYFPPGRLPARTCIGVTGLARGARVEIDLLARRAQD